MEDETWGEAYGRGRQDRRHDSFAGLPRVRRVTVGPTAPGYDAGYDAELDFEKTLAGIKDREERRTPEQKASDTTFRLILASIAAVLAVLIGLALVLGPRIELVLKSQPWAASYYATTVVAPLNFGNRLNNFIQSTVHGFRSTGSGVPNAAIGMVAKGVGGTVTTLYAVLLLWLIYRIFWRIWWMRWVGLLLIIGPICLAAARHAMT